VRAAPRLPPPPHRGRKGGCQGPLNATSDRRGSFVE